MRRGGENRGVEYRPLTPLELGTLRAFSEGMTTRELAEARRTSLRAIRRVLERLRLKLGVYTNHEMMYKVGRERIIE